MYEGERCIIFDESGNLGRVGRYFVIACIDTTECKALHNVMKRKLKIADDKFPDMKKDHAHEIKAVDAYPCVKHHILECIASKNLSVSYIVADLQHVKPKLLEDKNILYNYLMKLLLDRIISSKDSGTRINILCDNKTTKITSKNSFEDYIKIHFNCEKDYDIDLNVRYMDSDAGDAFVVQAADYVANAIYSYYEYDNGIYKDILIPKFNSTQHFTYEHFGKKQLTEK